MSLPLRLLPSQVILTGNLSVQNLLVEETKVGFGTVYQSYTDSPQVVKVGDCVMFHWSDVTEVRYNETTYYLLDENKIKLIENPVI